MAQEGAPALVPAPNGAPVFVDDGLILRNFALQHGGRYFHLVREYGNIRLILDVTSLGHILAIIGRWNVHGHWDIPTIGYADYFHDFSKTRQTGTMRHRIAEAYTWLIESNTITFDEAIDRIGAAAERAGQNADQVKQFISDVVTLYYTGN